MKQENTQDYKAKDRNAMVKNRSGRGRKLRGALLLVGLGLACSPVFAGVPIELDMASCQPVSGTKDGCNFSLPCPPGRYLVSSGNECSYTNCDGGATTVIPTNNGKNVGVSCDASPTPGDSYVTIQLQCCAPVGGTSGVPANLHPPVVSGPEGPLPPLGAQAPLSAGTGVESVSMESLNQSRDLLGTAAQQSAGFGVVDCLEALNKSLTDQDAAHAQAGICMTEVDAAKQLQEKAAVAAQRAGSSLPALAPDPKIMSSDRVQSAKAAYEKNFGSASDDLVKGLLSGPGRSALEEALQKKWAAEKAATFLDAAEEQKGKADFAVDLSQKRASPALAKSALRDKLKNNLAGETEAKSNRKPSESGAKEIDSPDQELQSLTPLKDPLFHSGHGETEYSLFDVVRRKYREKWEMLVPYRARKH